MPKMPFAIFIASGIVGLHLGALGEQRFDDRNRRRLAHVVGLGLERQPPHRDGLALERSEMRFDLLDEQPLLALVDGIDRLQDLEVVLLVGRELGDRLDVLWESSCRRSRRPETGTTVPMRRSAPTAWRTRSTSAPNRSQTLAISFMNEIFVARIRIRGVLRQLGAGAVHHHDRRAGAGEGLMQLHHQLGRARDPPRRSRRDRVS